MDELKGTAISEGRTSRKLLLFGLLLAALYVGALGLTKAHFMADSGGYVVSILAYAGVDEYVTENPLVENYRSQNAFWDFGHLFWRPVGFLLFKIFGRVSKLVIGPDPASNLYFLFMSLNFVAGLLSVLLLYALMNKYVGPALAVLVSTCFIFSHAFLNFTQTASSYVPGLAFLMVALYLLFKDKGNLSPLTAICAGLACAGAMTLWTPYILVIPGTIAAPLLLFDLKKHEKQSVLYAAAAFLIVTAIAYLLVMAAVGINSLSDVRDWISASSHGVRTSGLARMVFGLPRSFIHMGNDGVLFKRFLLNDPFNPVTATDLVRLSLWKLVLFYIALGTVVLALVASRARRILLLLLLTALPLIVFAIRFDGGAVERYLPIYPVIFLSVAYVLSEARVPRLLKIMPLVFFGFTVLTNASVMSHVVLDAENQKTSQRVQAVVPLIKPYSWLVTTHLQDELVNFQASLPFEPINRHNQYHVYPLVVPNSDQAAEWRQEFAANMLEAWGKGGDAWLSTRLFSGKPESSWNWVEGDDPRVRWDDIYKFFSQFETGDRAGGADGFVLLEKSEANAQLLNSTIHSSLSTSSVEPSRTNFRIRGLFAHKHTKTILLYPKWVYEEYLQFRPVPKF